MDRPWKAMIRMGVARCTLIQKGTGYLKMRIKLSLSSLIIFSILFTACGIFDPKTPVPEDKKSFIGVWKTGSGFTMDIRENGAAYLKQIGAAGNPDFDPVTIQIAPLNSPEMMAQFKGDTALLLIKPMFYAKQYKIDRAPYQENSKTKLVLNGVIFNKEQ
jgi:hypothetical protein